MKKTQKSHDSTSRMSLSLEELSAYIENRLSPKERDSVEEFLKDNPLYQETLAILQESYAEEPASIQEFAHAEQHFEKALEREVRQIRAEKVQSTDPIDLFEPIPGSSSWETAKTLQPSSAIESPWYTQQWVKLAASFILILGIAAVLFGGSFFQSPAMQFAQQSMVHYEPQAQMSSTSDEALGLYRAERYQEALPVLKAALAEGNTSEMQEKLNMFVGVSYAQLGQLRESIPFFQEVLTAETGGLKLDAQWYLSLVYTQLKEKEKAIPILQSIGDYQVQSREQQHLVDKAQELLGLIR